MTLPSGRSPLLRMTGFAALLATLSGCPDAPAPASSGTTQPGGSSSANATAVAKASAAPEPSAVNSVAARPEAKPKDLQFHGWHPSGESIAVSRGKVLAVVAASGDGVVQFGPYPGEVHGAAFSADGSQIALTTGGRLEVWNVAPKKRVHHFKAKELVKVWGVGRLSPDGSMVATSHDEKCHAWRLADGKRLASTRSCSGAAFSSDGKRFLTTVDNVSVVIMDLQSGAEIREVDFSTGGTWPIALSPNGRWAAGASKGGHLLEVVDLDSNVRRTVTEADHDDGVAHHFMSLDFSSNSKLLRVRGGSKYVRAYETGSWKRAATLNVPASLGRDDVDDVSMSDDGALAFVRTKELLVYDTTTNKLLSRLPLAAGAVPSPKKYLLALTGGQSVKIVEAKTGKLVREFRLAE